MGMLNECPESEMLHHWLQDPSSSPSDPVALHLGLCPRCQEFLEAATGTPQPFPRFSEGNAFGEFSSDKVENLLAMAAARGKEGLPTTELPTGATVGRYLVGKQVGRGGGGVVFRGTDQLLGRTVALKVVPHPENSSDTGGGTREVMALARLQRLRHPNLANIFDFLHVGSGESRLAVLVLEFIDGESIQKKIERGLANSCLPGARQTVAWLAGAARAVASAHREGITHCDLKPSNLLVDKASGMVRVIDFGLARLAGENPVNTLSMRGGTPVYMAPEVLAGHPASPASDIYSLGVSLFQCLTGEYPFRGSPAQVVRAISQDTPPSPRALDPGIPPELDIICQKAMARTPADRYAGADQFADDLGRWLEGRPILARPAHLWRHVVLWADRHRSLTALLLVLAVSMTACFSMLARLAWVETRAATAALADAENLREAARRADENLDGLLEAELALVTLLTGDPASPGRAVASPGPTALEKRKLLDKVRDRIEKASRMNQEEGVAGRLDRFGRKLALHQGEILLRLGKPREADEKFREVVASGQGVTDWDAETNRLILQATLHMGDGLLRDNRPGEAMELYRQVRLGSTRTNEQTTRESRLAILALKGEGQSATRLGRPLEAESAYSAALELLSRVKPDQSIQDFRSDHAFLRARLTDLRMAQGDWQDAMIHARISNDLARIAAGIGSGPAGTHEFAGASLVLSGILLRLGDTSGAVAAAAESAVAMSKISGMDPSRMDWLHQEFMAQASLGEALWNDGRPSEALSALERASNLNRMLLARDPSNIQFYTQRMELLSRKADLLIRMGRRMEAAATFREAGATSPPQGLPGQLAAKLASAAAALEAKAKVHEKILAHGFEKAISMATTPREAAVLRLWRGHELMAKGERKDAISSISATMGLENDPEIAFLVARLRARLATDKTSRLEALEAVRGAIQIDQALAKVAETEADFKALRSFTEWRTLFARKRVP